MLCKPQFFKGGEVLLRISYRNRGRGVFYFVLGGGDTFRLTAGGKLSQSLLTFLLLLLMLLFKEVLVQVHVQGNISELVTGLGIELGEWISQH